MKQIELGPTVHLPLHELEAGDLPLGLAVHCWCFAAVGIRRRRFERSRRQRRFRPGALQRRLCHEQVFRPRADAGTLGRTWRQVACSPRLRATSDAVVAGEWLSGVRFTSQSQLHTCSHLYSSWRAIRLFI